MNPRPPMRYALPLAASLLLVAAQAASAQTAPLIAPSQPIAGASQEEWSKRWWRWALSFDDDDSPVTDPDGSQCAAGQSGPVWYMAGTYGTARTIRSCQVPAGKTLFFPLVNELAVEPDDAYEFCASLKRRAARQTPASSALVLEVNGRRFKAGLKRIG